MSPDDPTTHAALIDGNSYCVHTCTRDAHLLTARRSRSPLYGECTSAGKREESTRGKG